MSCSQVSSSVTLPRPILVTISAFHDSAFTFMQWLLPSLAYPAPPTLNEASFRVGGAGYARLAVATMEIASIK